MKIDFNKATIILKTITVVATICLNIIIFIIGVNIKVSIILLFFSVFMICIGLLYERLYKKHTEDILINLSDMLDSIINMRDEEIFSVLEDSLFSKLQHQTIKLTNILKKQNEQIKYEKNEIKTLISDIAHQLKTPLTNLKMYGEFLQDESLSKEERKEFNEIMMISLNRLSFLVESMIKMSRLESGVIQLKPKESNLNDTILSAIGQVWKKAKSKDINIKLEGIEKLNIIHDKNWCSEAFFNILENAVKYTPKDGEINVNVQRYEMFVRVDIKDNGVGINDDELSKIFKRFYRGKNSRDVEGIGIGLYLTREIITRQGGYIKVNSNKDGSKFSVFLPS